MSHVLPVFLLLLRPRIGSTPASHILHSHIQHTEALDAAESRLQDAEEKLAAVERRTKKTEEGKRQKGALVKKGKNLWEERIQQERQTREEKSEKGAQLRGKSETEK